MKKYDIEQMESKLKIPKKLNDSYCDGLQFGGYRILKECLSEKFYQAINIDGINQSVLDGYIHEGHIESNAYLYLLERLDSLKKNVYNMVELGTGYGAPSLAFAGFVDNSDIFPNIKNYNILGIEGEKNHYKWTKQILSEQIKGNVNIINGAVTNYDGYINFLQGNSSDNYGQAINGSGESVECFRLETLLNNNNVSFVDFLHMDIQGEEVNVFQDSVHLLSKINFMHIGTHSHERHNDILKIINESNLFNIIFNIPYGEIVDVPGFGVIKPHPCADGVIFCENKNIK
jgi:FkbM family methyltransferase